MNISKEDYIKAIYELGGYARQVPNKEIATRLGVSAPSVSEMIKKLLKDGYLEYQEYIGVSLTQLGIDLGRKVRKRHLLWEVFLVDCLGYSWQEVASKAEKLEHVTDDKLEARLEKFLDYPIECPHGAPIFIDHGEYRNLLDLEVGDIGQILRFDKSSELEDFIATYNLQVGDFLKLDQVFDSYLLLSKNRLRIKISLGLAEKIFIK